MNDAGDQNGASDPGDPAALVRERLVADHGPLLDAVGTCADAVAARWAVTESDGDPETTDGDTLTAAGAPATANDPTTATGPLTANRDAVVPALREALTATEVIDSLPGLLATGADALGVALPASPVAAPPYLVVTATGPVVRATLPDAGRLVVSVRVFDVDRSGETPRYRRLEADVREALRVELR